MVSKFFKNKSGAVFFTLDTLIAGLIILVTLILVLSIHSSKPDVENTYHELTNYMNFLTETSMRDIRNHYGSVYNNPFEEDLDLFVYQKIYKLYLENNESEARSIVGNLTPIIISPQIGLEYAVDDWVVFLFNNNTREFARSSVTNRVLTYVVDEDGDVHLTTTNITVWD